MKNILPLLLIAFLVSCQNQGSSGNADEKESDVTEIPPTGITEVEPLSKDSLMHPDPDTQNAASAPGEEGAPDNDGSTLFKMGTTAYANDDYKKGVGYFEEITSRYPNDRRAYYNLGLGYFKLDRFKDALGAFNKAIEIYQHDSLSLQYRGRVYYMLGDFKNCLKDYEKVVELKPNDPIAYYNRGTARGRTKDYTGAIADFDRAVELNPEYAEAFYNRGLANFHLGRMHDACFDWRKAHGLGHFEAEKALRAYCEGNPE